MNFATLAGIGAQPVGVTVSTVTVDLASGTLTIVIGVGASPLSLLFSPSTADYYVNNDGTESAGAGIKVSANGEPVLIQSAVQGAPLPTPWYAIQNSGGPITIRLIDQEKQ